MPCPVHIWAPMMAAAVPFSRTARDRISATRDRLLHRAPRTERPARPMQRWAPIAPGAARATEEQSTPR